MELNETTRHAIALAEPLYNPELPYHNWDHAQAVMEGIEPQVEKMGVRGRRVRVELGAVAAAWHDVRHDDVEGAKQYGSKEEYAAALMQQHLAEILSEEDREVVAAAILDTRAGVSDRSDLGIVLHYADIANIGYRDYDAFFAATIKLWREAGSPDWTTWRDNACRTIDGIIDEAYDEFTTIGLPTGSRDSFTICALSNLSKLQTADRPK